MMLAAHKLPKQNKYYELSRIASKEKVLDKLKRIISGFASNNKMDQAILDEYKRRRDFYVNMFERNLKNSNLKTNDMFIKKLKTTN